MKILKKKKAICYHNFFDIILIIQYLLIQINSINMKKSPNLKKTIKQKQYNTNQHSDNQQDMQIRQSPQPTLSTNRFYKSKSTKQSDFKKLARNKSSSQYITAYNLLSTNREIQQQQQQHYENLINKLLKDWTKITKQELNSSYIKVLYEDDTLQPEMKVKINFLIALKQVLILKYKIRDAEFNYNLIKSDQKLKAENLNKLIILQLLLTKLKKKLFIECLKFNLKLKELNLIWSKQKKNNIFINITHKFIFTTKKLIKKRLNEAFINIKTSNKIDQLFSSINSPQSQNKKYLQITLSPTKFFNYNNRPTQKQELKNPLKETSFIIRSLEKDAQNYQGKFEQSSIKYKHIYFLRWKIMFLKKYQEKLTRQHFQYNKLKKYFNILKEYRQENFIKIEEDDDIKKQQIQQLNMKPLRSVRQQTLQQDSDQEIQNKKNLKFEKKILKKKLRQKQILNFFNKFKQYRDTRKIYKICRVIYNNNQYKKIFSAWKTNIFKNHTQDLEKLWEFLVNKNNFNKLQKIQQVQEYSFKRDQKHQEYSSCEQYLNISSRYEQKISNVSADLFYTNNLKVKVFFFLKNTFIYTKGASILHIAILKIGFMKIKKHKQQIDKLYHKIMRFQSKRMKLLLFKYFSKLKQSIYNSPQNIDKVSYYLKQKNFETKTLIFSTLKLEYKKYLIKFKKAEKMNEYFIKRKIFDQIIKMNLQYKKIRLSKEKLTAFLYKKNSIQFFKKFVRFEAINQNKKLKKIQFTQTYKQDNLKYRIFQEWKKYITRKRNFKIILMRYKKLKEKQLKKNIFRSLLKQVYQNSIQEINRNDHNQQELYSQKSIESEYSNSMRQSIKSVHSKEHRYWLNKYYQNLCSFIK